MADNSIFTKTEITIQDYNSNNPVVFSGLTLSESLIDVNHFSFTVRPSETGSSLGAIIDFKKQVLGKEVQIELKDSEGNGNHKFKGIALEVNSTFIDNQFYEFYISGSGIFCKVNEIAESHSFYKKKLDDIIARAFEKTKVKDQVKKNPQTTKELHYIVQYQQTLFNFVVSLATRFGEWMFYDGENLQFGKKPEGDAIELQSPGDVTNLNIKAQVLKNPESTVATDIFKSETIKSSTKEQAPENDLIKAAADAGEQVFENPGGGIFLSSGFKQDDSDDKFKLEQQAILASSVLVTGNSRNSKLTVGKVIKIKEGGDSSGASFIITQVQHYASGTTTYTNSFTAVPAEVGAPPYTNPFFVPRATPQAAVITDNEDDGGLARVKVKFPWMGDDEKSPWISVLTPHAGKNKGFRFLPEKEDEVLVDFWDHNAETPYVAGAVYTEKNKPGIAEGGNNLKLIGTRTGRRFEIDDDNGKIIIRDFTGDNAGNNINLLKKDDNMRLILSSGSETSYVNGAFDGQQGVISFAGIKGSQAILSIVLNMETEEIAITSLKTVKIEAKSNIDLSANEINLNASKITINANDKLAMKGTSEASLEGTAIKINADANLEATAAASAKLEGAMLDLKGSGIANLKGGLVQIN